MLVSSEVWSFDVLEVDLCQVGLKGMPRSFPLEGAGVLTLQQVVFVLKRRAIGLCSTAIS